jgi:hypothetical protein
MPFKWVMQQSCTILYPSIFRWENTIIVGLSQSKLYYKMYI